MEGILVLMDTRNQINSRIVYRDGIIHIKMAVMLVEIIVMLVEMMLMLIEMLGKSSWRTRQKVLFTEEQNVLFVCRQSIGEH